MAKAKTKKKFRPRLRLRVRPDEIDYSALTWYQDATKLIQQLYGEYWRLFVDVLAATSPRQSIKRNWRQTAEIVAAYIDRENKPNKFGDVLADVMTSYLPNVLRALAGRPLSGPKVSRFAENLRGNLDVVTIDVWICKAYGVEPKQLTPALYDKLEAKIIAEAKEANATPAGYQAVIWYTVRRLAGKRVRSFVSVYRSIFMETPYFSFMQDD